MAEEPDDDLAGAFSAFATVAGRDGAPVYEQICAAVAEDPGLLALMEAAPPDQRRPNLLLATVHFLLLGGAAHPLAAHYDTVQSYGGPLAASPNSVAADFASFCEEHRDEVTGLLGTRATQTNEVGRCSALLPAFATVAGAHARPLALIDLGTSAGLNLLFDRYAYDYGSLTAGQRGATVALTCELRQGTPPLALPAVVHRAGLDRSPIDPDDPVGSRWLLACQWPGHLARFDRLRQALDIARHSRPHPALETGDLIDDLPRVVAQAPDDAHLCLFHSWVAAYLTPERQADLVATLAEVSLGRPLSWIFAESPLETPGLPRPEAPRHVKGATAVVLGEFEHGRLEARRLGDMHPHGSWLYWWDQPGAQRDGGSPS